MRKSMLLEFPVVEYEARLKKLLEKMAEKNFDAVIFTSRENLRYFSGLQGVSWDSKRTINGILIITRKGEMFLVGSDALRGTMSVTSCVEDIRGIHHYRKDGTVSSLPKILHEILQEKGCDSGRIGMELGYKCRINMPVNDYLELVRLCNKGTIVDCSEIIFPLRMIKSKREIIFIKKLSEITCKAFEFVMNNIKEGMTECDVYRDTLREMLRLGADETYLCGVRAGKERYGQPDCNPSERPIRRGEMILMDGGCIYKGYISDIIRQAIIGKPTDIQKKYYEISVTACEKALNAIKPGTPVKEICKAVNKYYTSQELTEHLEAGCGHGLGLDIHENPDLDEKNENLLIPGMVISVEPCLYIPNEGMFGIEENILIDEKGYELLTPMTRELLVLS